MPTQLMKLQDRAAEIVRTMQAQNDTLAEEDRLELTEEEQAQYDVLEKELDQVEAGLARERKLQERERNLTPVREIPTDGSSQASQLLSGSAAEGSGQPGFESFGQMLQAVARAGMQDGSLDPRLLAPQAATGLSEGVPSEGGFLVGSETTNELLKAIYDTGILASRCSRTPIGAGKNSLEINGIDETSRADGSQWGGVVAYWESEAAEKTASKPKFRRVKLKLQKLIGLCYATDELIEDAVALEAIIREAFPNVFGFKIDDGIIRGTGAGQLKGILSTGPKVQVSKETGQAAKTIVAENVEKMYARMWAKGMANAVWTINQDCWPQIFQLHHVIGTGGVPMFIPAGGINQTPFGTLLGRPILPIEQAATLGTEGDIMLCDFSQYKLIDKGGIKSAVSIHVRFVNDESVYRFVLRVDGQPTWASPLTPAQGTNTVSPFVTLKVRA